MDNRKRGRDDESANEGRKVFVYNLPWEMQWQQLKDLFSQAGNVTYAGIIREGGPTGRSKGCGTVEFATPEEAQSAINLFNGYEHNGRAIYVRLDIRDPSARVGDNILNVVGDSGKRLKIGGTGTGYGMGAGGGAKQGQGFGMGAGGFGAAGMVGGMGDMGSGMGFGGLGGGMGGMGGMGGGAGMLGAGLGAGLDMSGMGGGLGAGLGMGMGNDGSGMQGGGDGGMGGMGGGLGSGLGAGLGAGELAGMGGLGGGMGGMGGMGGGDMMGMGQGMGGMGNMGMGGMGGMGNMGMGGMGEMGMGGMGMGGMGGMGGGMGGMGMGGMAGMGMPGMGGMGMGGMGGMSGNRRLFVSGLNFKTTWQQVKDLFKQVGPVLYCTIIKDQQGRSKGCGIVEFESPAHACVALNRFNGYLLDNFNIQVREDQKMQAGGPGGGGMGGGMGPGMGGGMGGRGRDFQGGSGIPVEKRANCQVVVHGIPFSYENPQLKDMFRPVGVVLEANVRHDPASGRSKGYGTVLFKTAEEAERAIEMFNQTPLHGRNISVKLDDFVQQAAGLATKHEEH